MVKRSVFGSILATIGLFALQGSALTFAATSGSVDFTVDATQTVLELTVPSNTTTINLAPSVSGASFGAANLNVHVATNNQTGYTLTMTPENTHNDPTKLFRTELIGDEVNYRYIAALAQTNPVSTGYPEADFTTNAWGYKITGNNYYGINSTNPTVSSPAWVTDEPTNGDTQSLTLATKIDAATATGSYATTLVFTATTNAVVAKDTVSFNGNGANNSTAMGNYSFIVQSGNSVTLPENLYTKSGYAFLGWNTQSDGKGLSYSDAGIYSAVSTDYNQNITLYAQWANSNSEMYQRLHPSGSTPSSGVTISLAYEIAYTAAGKGMWEQDEGDRDNDGDTTEYYQVSDDHYNGYDVRWDMQGMTPEICNSVTVLEDSYEAIDVRDFNKYNIAKLADGRCWLRDNLDLNPLDSNVVARISSSTTNATSSALYNFLNGGNPDNEPGWTSYAVDYAGTRTYQGAYTPYTNSSYSQLVPSDTMSTEGGWKIGTYYNFCAATAGTFCYPRDTYYSDTIKYIDNDLCPLGWKMPTSNLADSEAYILYSTYGNSFRSITRMPLSGRIENQGAVFQGKYGNYWGANIPFGNNSSNSAAFVNQDNVTISNSGFVRYSMISIRCVAH